MKCDNNSIYELQDGIYMAHKVPLGMLYDNIRWHFSDFKNS